MTQIVHLALSVYAFGLIAYSVLSWVQHPQAFAARKWLERWYEPLLQPIRRTLRPVQMGNVQLDLAVIVLLIVILLVRNLLVSILVGRF